MAPSRIQVGSFPLGDRKLSPKEWAHVEALLDEWKRDVLKAAKAHPAKSYKLGVAQVEAFSKLLTGLPAAAPARSAFGGVSESMKQAARWQQTYTLHELDDALNVYIGKIKDALLYGLRHQVNPTQVASWLYNATKDATVNWRMIARTEMVRANAVGRLDAAAAAGYEKVWVPPHVGSCPRCKELLENRVFLISEVRDATNYGRKAHDWIPTCPLHPHCRHSYLPYDEEIYEEAMAHYRAMEAAGLTDEDTLDEMFDSSGQLREGVELTPEQMQAASWGKTQMGDLYAEGLAVAVEKVLDRRAGVDQVHKVHKVHKERLPLYLLRPALHQPRAAEPDRVLNYAAAVKRGEQLPPIEVERWPTGECWVTDGQHRAWARELAGEHEADCLVTDRSPWGERTAEIRDAVHNVWQPTVDPGDVAADADPDLNFGKDAPVDLASALLIGEIAESSESADSALDPLLFDGGRLRDDVAMAASAWWARVAGEEWAKYSTLIVSRHGGPLQVVVDYDALRQHVRAYSHFSDADLHFALVAAARGAGRDVAELAPGLPMDLRIRPFQPEAHPLAYDGWDVSGQHWYGELPVDLHDVGKVFPAYVFVDESNVGDRGPVDKETAVLLSKRLLTEEEFLAKATSSGWHVAPANARGAILEHGLIQAQPNDRWQRYGAASEPAGIYVWTDHARAKKWAHDLAELVGHNPLAANDVWHVDLHGLPTERDPVLGDEGALYVALPSIPAERLSLDVGKAAGPGAANAGVEHWITIHPHGEDEKGQPVLVRNGADGSMTVIGGAGGNLNMMRLDPSRRVDRDAGQKAKGASRVEQDVSSEDAERSAAEREQEITQAQEQLDKLKAQRQAITADLHSAIAAHLGIDVGDLDHKEARKLLAKVRTSALRTLAYGEVSRRDAQDGPDAETLGLDKDDAPKGLDDTENDSQENQEPRTPRPSVAMSSDTAAQLLGHYDDLNQVSRQGSQHRKVIAGDATASDAAQIDWSAGADDQAKQQRINARADQLVRTDLARNALEHGDRYFRKDGKGYQERYYQAFQQGGYDSIDAFSHSVLGKSVLSKDGAKLLGIAGAAQLVAHSIQQKAVAEGKSGLELGDLGKDKGVQGALKALTDDQERAVNERGTARVQQALERAAEATREHAKTKQGESLYTTTMALSMQSEKLQEARRQTGMLVGGLEAASQLKQALDRKAGEKIKVGGFKTPGQIRKLAERAGVKVHDGDIKRIGAGNYTLVVPPERLEGLLRPEPPVNQEMRDRLQKIRTGEGLAQEIEANRTGPGMKDVLDANQAKGKMALLTAGSHLLGFDPGVGKTHTAIAAAMQLMHDEPEKGHRALIVAPTNMLRSWRDTIASQGSGHTISMVGESAADASKDTGSTKQKLAQMQSGSHFTIVSYETLKSPTMRKALRDMHGQNGSHSIVVADELQKSKNEDSQNFAGVEQAVDHAVDQHGAGTGAHFFGLTGTPVEKDVSDVSSMRRLVRKAKGEDAPDRKTVRAKYGKLGQDEHIARGDKVRQFRQGLDEDLFRLSAQDAGNGVGDLMKPRHEVKVKLDDDHKAALQERVNGLNAQIADYHQAREEGREASMPSFGGRQALLDGLYNHNGGQHAMARAAADRIEQQGSFDFKGMPEADSTTAEYSKGDHAGTYEHKSLVFGANEHSQALFGPNWRAGQAGGLHKELEDRGIKVFIGHGSMASSKNEANYKAFLAHEGKAVFLTNDKNNAGISLQFGDNKGRFQHGATHVMHYTRPVNNATIQQREARALRKGAAAPVQYDTVSADTPMEKRLEDTLHREARTQDLAANSEQHVATGGQDARATLAHHLADRGIKTSG